MCLRPLRFAAAALLAACTADPATDTTPRERPVPTLLAAPQIEALPGFTAPPVTRLEIALGGPIPVNPDSRPETVAFSAVVDIPAGTWTGGEALRLSGVFGTATVTWDGVLLGTVPPGPGSTELGLVGKAAPGPHSLSIALTRADPPVPMVRAGDRRATPLLIDPPTLLLRPAAHVRNLALPLAEGRVSPIAQVAGAPEGAQVRFLVARDGAVVADLGVAPVVEGVAAPAPQEWTLPQWQVGAPVLYFAFALLEGADGTVIDSFGTRVGPRGVALDPVGITVGGKSQRLVAWRSNPRAFTPADFGSTDRTGTNMYEFHGSPPTEDQLSVCDEVGIAVVITPRCEGTFEPVPNADRAAVVEAHLPLIREQSARMAWDVINHPSVVLWVSESRSLTALGAAIAETDPERKPVVNVHLPMENVTLGRETEPQNYAGAWVGETLWEGPPGDVEVTLAAFGKALAEGVRGGVLEHIEDPARQVRWAKLLRKEGIEPLVIDGQRASARVEVSGVMPGVAVWIEAPWLPAAGRVANASKVGVSAYFTGNAEVVIGALRRPVDLAPLVWSVAGAHGTVAQVSVAQ